MISYGHKNKTISSSSDLLIAISSPSHLSMQRWKWKQKPTANVYVYLLHLEPCFFMSIPEASFTQPDYEHVRNWESLWPGKASIKWYSIVVILN